MQLLTSREVVLKEIQLTLYKLNINGLNQPQTKSNTEVNQIQTITKENLEINKIENQFKMALDPIIIHPTKINTIINNYTTRKNLYGFNSNFNHNSTNLRS